MKPEPLTPPDCDLRDFSWMPLEVGRLRDSEMVVLVSGDAFRAAVLLWCAAWQQVPAASLPNDDRLLASLAGYGRDLKGWAAVRNDAMRGFIECRDGRFYHPLVAEKAIEADLQRKKQRKRTEAATLARRGERSCEQRDDQPPEERHEHRDGAPDHDRHEVQQTGPELTGPEIEHDGGGEARARELLPETKCLISEAAIRIASEVLGAMGLASDDPRSVGAPIIVQSWLNGGWPPDIIMIGVQRTMQNRQGDPPSSLKYFEKAIARQHAEAARPLPVAIIQPQEKFHVQAGRRYSESLSDIAMRHAASGISFGPRPTGLPKPQGGATARLLPQG